MAEPQLVKKAYIGDGVYADFDGYHIILTTEDGFNAPSNTIYLDSIVLGTLDRFRERVRAALEAQKQEG